MKRTKQRASPLGGFSSGASLGGKVSHYRRKQNIYKQGAPAYTLFYIHEGGVRLSTRTKHQPSAVTAILGVGDLFGELCLAGYPLRVSTAVALTASSVRTIQTKEMLRMLRKYNKTSNALVAYLVSSIKKYQDHVPGRSSPLEGTSEKPRFQCGIISGLRRSGAMGGQAQSERDRLLAG
jgi:CRP-like cAMP-binding protein